MLATKGGLVVEQALPEIAMRRDGRPEHVREAIDASLRRLQTDHVDLYQLHRVDPEVPVEETWGAMAETVAAGKARAIGMCEATLDELEQAHADPPGGVAAERVLALDPRPARRRAALVRRARRGVHPLLAARAAAS